MAVKNDNKGMGVVRIKPLGAGGGGVESSSYSGQSSVRYNTENASLSILDKSYDFPKMVVPPTMSQEALFNEFMPSRIEGFLSGYNVNILAYGKHTLFVP